MQQQVDVNASHLEKERHQLAEQIKKVLWKFVLNYTALAKSV